MKRIMLKRTEINIFRHCGAIDELKMSYSHKKTNSRHSILAYLGATYRVGELRETNLSKGSVNRLWPGAESWIRIQGFVVARREKGADQDPTTGPHLFSKQPLSLTRY